MILENIVFHLISIGMWMRWPALCLSANNTWNLLGLGIISFVYNQSIATFDSPSRIAIRFSSVFAVVSIELSSALIMKVRSFYKHN